MNRPRRRPLFAGLSAAAYHDAGPSELAKLPPRPAVDRGALLRMPIKSLDDARTFILGLIGLDLLFHFEDDPADVCRVVGNYTFQPCEVPLVRDRIRELYALPREVWAPDDCPIGFALTLSDPGWKNHNPEGDGQ